MNKPEFIKVVAEESGVDVESVKKVIEASLNKIQENLVKKESTSFMGFGTFLTKDKPERVSRNPKTGEKVNTPPKTVIKFKPAGRVIDAVDACNRA